MSDHRASILARIGWCQWQRTLAVTPLEREAWRAEEEGLRDAFLNRDHTKQYRYTRFEVFERYAMGIEDGKTLIRLAHVEKLLSPTYNQPTNRP